MDSSPTSGNAKLMQSLRKSRQDRQNRMLASKASLMSTNERHGFGRSIKLHPDAQTKPIESMSIDELCEAIQISKLDDANTIEKLADVLRRKMEEHGHEWDASHVDRIQQQYPKAKSIVNKAYRCTMDKKEVLSLPDQVEVVDHAGRERVASTLRSMSISKRGRHNEAVEAYEANEKHVSEVIDADLATAAANCKDALLRRAFELRMRFRRVSDDRDELVGISRDERDAIATEAKSSIDEYSGHYYTFLSFAKSLEQDRKAQVEEHIRRLSSSLMEIAFLTPDEVQHEMEKLSIAANLTLTANEKALSDLQFRFEAETIELQELLDKLVAKAMENWEAYNQDEIVRAYDTCSLAPKYKNPPTRQDFFALIAKEQMHSREVLLEYMSGILATASPAHTCTPELLDTWKESFTQFLARLERRTESFVTGMQQINTDIGLDVSSEVDTMRSQLAYYGMEEEKIADTLQQFQRREELRVVSSKELMTMGEGLLKAQHGKVNTCALSAENGLVTRCHLLSDIFTTWLTEMESKSGQIKNDLGTVRAESNDSLGLLEKDFADLSTSLRNAPNAGEAQSRFDQGVGLLHKIAEVYKEVNSKSLALLDEYASGSAERLSSYKQRLLDFLGVKVASETPDNAEVEGAEAPERTIITINGTDYEELQTIEQWVRLLISGTSTAAVPHASEVESPPPVEESKTPSRPSSSRQSKRGSGKKADAKSAKQADKKSEKKTPGKKGKDSGQEKRSTSKDKLSVPADVDIEEQQSGEQSLRTDALSTFPIPTEAELTSILNILDIDEPSLVSQLTNWRATVLSEVERVCSQWHTDTSDFVESNKNSLNKELTLNLEKHAPRPNELETLCFESRQSELDQNADIFRRNMLVIIQGQQSKMRQAHNDSLLAIDASLHDLYSYLEKKKKLLDNVVQTNSLQKLQREVAHHTKTFADDFEAAMERVCSSFQSLHSSAVKSMRSFLSACRCLEDGGTFHADELAAYDKEISSYEATTDDVEEYIQRAKSEFDTRRTAYQDRVASFNTRAEDTAVDVRLMEQLAVLHSTASGLIKMKLVDVDSELSSLESRIADFEKASQQYSDTGATRNRLVDIDIDTILLQVGCDPIAASGSAGVDAEAVCSEALKRLKWPVVGLHVLSSLSSVVLEARKLAFEVGLVPQEAVSGMQRVDIERFFGHIHDPVSEAVGKTALSGILEDVVLYEPPPVEKAPAKKKPEAKKPGKPAKKGSQSQGLRDSASAASGLETLVDNCVFMLACGAIKNKYIDDVDPILDAYYKEKDADRITRAAQIPPNIAEHREALSGVADELLMSALTSLEASQDRFAILLKRLFLAVEAVMPVVFYELTNHFFSRAVVRCCPLSRQFNGDWSEFERLRQEYIGSLRPTMVHPQHRAHVRTVNTAEQGRREKVRELVCTYVDAVVKCEQDEWAQYEAVLANFGEMVLYLADSLLYPEDLVRNKVDTSRVGKHKNLRKLMKQRIRHEIAEQKSNAEAAQAAAAAKKGGKAAVPAPASLLTGRPFERKVYAGFPINRFVVADIWEYTEDIFPEYRASKPDAMRATTPGKEDKKSSSKAKTAPPTAAKKRPGAASPMPRVPSRSEKAMGERSMSALSSDAHAGRVTGLKTATHEAAVIGRDLWKDRAESGFRHRILKMKGRMTRIVDDWSSFKLEWDNMVAKLLASSITDEKTPSS